MSEGGNSDIIYGIHSVQAALRRRPGKVQRLYVDGARKRRFGVILKLARQKNVPVEEAASQILRSLSEGGVHQGIVARCAPHQNSADIEELCCNLAQLEHPPLVLVLDRIGDPGNLGACLRSAAAFAADAVVLTQHHSAPLNALARKTAAGASEYLPLVCVGSLRHALDLLRDRLHLRLLATTVEPDAQAQAPHLIDLHSSGLALILGGEHGGVRASVLGRCDAAVYIPMSDQMDCLNVSAACAVLLYEIRRQRLVPERVLPPADSGPQRAG